MVIGHWHWWILIYETVNQATIIKKHHFLHWSRSKVQCWPGWRPSLGSLSVYISVLDPLVRVTTDTSYVSAPRLLCHGDTVSQSPLRDISCTPPALAHCNYCIVMVTHSSNIFSLNTGIWNNMLTVHWHSLQLQQYSPYFINHLSTKLHISLGLILMNIFTSLFQDFLHSFLIKSLALSKVLPTTKLWS